MRSRLHHHRFPDGFTLIEMTIVILILMTLLGTSLVINTKFQTWRKGREAAESLRAVYTAQRMFMSDNPTVAVDTINAAQLLPYMRNAPAALPTVKALNGAVYTISVNVSPPIISNGGVAYDPSGSRTDNLWDVGE